MIGSCNCPITTLQSNQRKLQEFNYAPIAFEEIKIVMINNIIIIIEKISNVHCSAN